MGAAHDDLPGVRLLASRPQAPVTGGVRGLREGDPRRAGGDRVADGRTSGTQPGRRRAHPGAAPRVRQPQGHSPAGRGAPVLRAQDRDRTGGSVRHAASAGGTVRLPVPGGERARCAGELPRLDLAVVGGRDREGPPRPWRARPLGRRRHRRRGADRRSRLGGPQLHRGGHDPPAPQARHRHQRQRAVLRADRGRTLRPPGLAAATSASCRGARSASSSRVRPDAPPTPRCAASSAACAT